MQAELVQLNYLTNYKICTRNPGSVAIAWRCRADNATAGGNSNCVAHIATCYLVSIFTSILMLGKINVKEGEGVVTLTLTFI